MRLLGRLSLFRRYHICKERGAEAASPYCVSSIRDQQHKRDDLGGADRCGQYHEVMPQVLYSRSSTPEGWAQRCKPVANATARSTGSSTQALVKGASMMLAQLKGHWCRESAALGRGGLQAVTGPTQLIRQRSATAKPSKASHHAMHDESTCEDGSRRTTEREVTGRSQPWPAVAGC